MSGDKSYIWDDAVRAKYINTLLLKKYAGIPNTRPEADFSSEPAIPARTKIFSYQILKENIPREAPNPLSLNEDTSFRDKFKTYGGNLKPRRLTGPSPYTYIVKYENLPLSHIFNGISYRGPRKTDPIIETATDISENYLENIIPENYDISNSVSSYKITLTDKNGNPVTNNDESTWIIDPDAGVLSYYAKTRFHF